MLIKLIKDAKEVAKIEEEPVPEEAAKDIVITDVPVEEEAQPVEEISAVEEVEQQAEVVSEKEVRSKCCRKSRYF
ncbi:MAG: hypothetical protein MZV64_54815 [Ignavibacteriales bacterium]|nr:hypothetical protein [Ignavibacteriales bacterium]